jgi:redox-sensing transcriptional repressor
MTQRMSGKIVERLSQYRRLLGELAAEGRTHVFSHELGTLAGVTATRMRRDMMEVGYEGSSTRGYDVRQLMGAIGQFLDSPRPQDIALVGVGNLGRAILAYFSGRRPKLRITAAFDADPRKADRVIHGCRCYLMKDLSRVLAEKKIRIAVVAVPADAAQHVATTLIRSSVTGLLNFAPTHLRVPTSVYVEDLDITTALEKVAYFSRRDINA